MAERYTFRLDGADVTVEAEPKTAALDVLRDTLGFYTNKAGCAPQGLCGCCTALIDGKARLTCTLPIKSLAGKAVTTLAGVPAAERDRLADAFACTGAVQCGYCTAGIALSAHALLKADPAPTDEAITRALNVHTCRCTGYTAIAEAIRVAARGDAPAVDGRAREKALGLQPFVDDLERPGMLQGVVVAAGPGRLAELELPDLEGVSFVALKRVGDVLHAGEIVAAVAAPDLRAARDAATFVVAAVESAEAPSGVLARGRRTEGEPDRACVHVVEQDFELAATDPVYLEPEAALAVPTEEGLLVYSAGHDAHAEAVALTALLGAPVRVLLVPSGGSYGGKEWMTVQPAAALLAQATGRPVKIALGLEEGMRIHRRRPAARVRARVGCDGDGRELAVVLAVTLDGGAACAGADQLVAQALGALPYRCGDLAVSCEVVRSGAPPTAAIRGGGGIAATFALERCLDLIAARVGLDPRELRARNLDGRARAVLDALPSSPGGIGIARVDGSGGARVVLTRTGTGEIEVQCNVPNLGTRDEGLLAALAEASGLPASAFEVAWSDSAVVGPGAAAEAPVARAAAAAGRALAAGRTAIGEDPARGPAGWCAALATLDEAGALTLHVAVTGEGRVARNLAEGGAHMGAGIALSEEVEVKDGVPEARFRFLGVLKPKGSPRIVAAAVGGGGDAAGAAVMAVPAAIANAVSATEGARSKLPMKDSAAARAAGVRPAGRQ